MLLQLLLLLLVRWGSALVCPNECTCSQTSVDCSGAFLWDVPQNIPTGIISLDLAHNNLTILPDDVFQTIPNIVTLLLHNSAVEVAEPDAFRGLSVLGFLDLHNNRISHLHPGLFRHNPALSTLNLSGNRIRHMIDDTFSKNPVLSHVNLTGNPLVSVINWLDLGLFTSLSLGSRFCEPQHSSLTSTVFGDLNLERKEFKDIDVTNIIVYKLSSMTWAVLETPASFPVLCFCTEFSTWVHCGQEISTRTTCMTPKTISETFSDINCEYSNTRRELTTSRYNEGEFQDDVEIVPEVSSTPETPDQKPALALDRNLLVLFVAAAGVLIIIWVVTCLVFSHGRRKRRRDHSPSEASSPSLPGGSPLSLPENFAFNPAARHSATPDMLLTLGAGRNVDRDHIVYSSLNTIPTLHSHHLYSEVQDRIDYSCGKTEGRT